MTSKRRMRLQPAFWIPLWIQSHSSRLEKVVPLGTLRLSPVFKNWALCRLPFVHLTREFPVGVYVVCNEGRDICWLANEGQDSVVDRSVEARYVELATMRCIPRQERSKATLAAAAAAAAAVEPARLTPQCVVCKQKHVVAKETRAAPLYGKALK